MRFSITALLLTLLPPAQAQDWNQQWISAPQADSAQQVWFRHTYVLHERAAQASIRIASRGRYVLYVNQYNVSTDVLTPAETSRIAVMHHDVTRFMRPDTNVIAVWYAPPLPLKPTAKQLSLWFYGTLPSGKRFAYPSDSSWLCRAANVRTTAGGSESADGRSYINDWNARAPSILGWLPAVRKDIDEQDTPTDIAPIHPARRIAHIYNCRHIGDSGTDIAYRFERPFDGWVRLTLRGMRPGDTVSINGQEYICTGMPDEQACRRFTTAFYDYLTVSGPPSFSRANIMKIEGISIEDYIHRSYLY